MSTPAANTDSAATGASTAAASAAPASPGSTRLPTVLITGASRGIGAHLTRGFLAAGWRVVGISRRGGTPEGVTADDAFIALACDVTDEAAVASTVAQAIAELGRIDVLINNAGVIETEQPLWQADVDEWWGVLEANVRGPFLMARAVVPHMIEAGGGRVVDMNSGAGTKDSADLSAYNASKFALFRITGSLHRSGARHGIKAFDVAPGVIETDMTHSMRMHEGRTQWTDPRDLVTLVLALASGELDAYSGRMVRAGVDSVEALQDAAKRGLSPTARTLGLLPYGDDDPHRGLSTVSRAVAPCCSRSNGGARPRLEGVRRGDWRPGPEGEMPGLRLREG